MGQSTAAGGKLDFPPFLPSCMKIFMCASPLIFMTKLLLISQSCFLPLVSLL